MKPALEAAESAILHDMGAMLTSVKGFADLVVRAPDHPERERYISLVAAEAQRGVEALRDLQIVKALVAGDVRQRLETLDMGAVATAAGIEGAPSLDGMNVTADRGLIEEILTRCSQLSSGPARVEEGTGRILFPLQDVDVEAGLDSWRASLRPLALASHLLPLWGFEIQIESEQAVLVIPR